MQGQRRSTVVDVDHVMLVKGHHATGADRIHELRYCARRVRLIHEHAAADHRVERAALGKSGVETAFDEGEIGSANVARPRAGKFQHRRTSIDPEHMTSRPHAP